jgi:hypothetical protein
MQYIIAQDRYIMDVEMQNHRYRDLLFCCDKEFLRVEEFRNISQGSQKVQEYTTRFTRIMRYALGETDTENKKMYCFKNGLNSRLKVALSGHACRTLREMVNKVLEIERDRLEANALHKEKKHQFESSSHGPAPQRPCAHVLPPPCSRYT